jgi:hypothetical protein
MRPFISSNSRNRKVAARVHKSLRRRSRRRTCSLANFVMRVSLLLMSFQLYTLSNVTMFFLAVIINEHLMEALRRLRRNSSDTNVDRRLVTNVLLQFLAVDRADPKKFEMLTLLASILSWTDTEREKAGLQRTNAGAKSSSFWSRSASMSPRSAAHAELDKTDETEVCILAFVFLITLMIY